MVSERFKCDPCVASCKGTLIANTDGLDFKRETKIENCDPLGQTPRQVLIDRMVIHEDLDHTTVKDDGSWKRVKSSRLCRRNHFQQFNLESQDGVRRNIGGARLAVRQRRRNKYLSRGTLGEQQQPLPESWNHSG